MRNSHKKLMESTEYEHFLKNEEGFDLVHCSYMKELGKKAGWEFGYYHSGRDRMVVFETDPIKRLPEQEVFKEGPTVNKLEMDRVKIEFDEAMDIAEKIRKEKYSSEAITKYIVILQNLDKQVWNITLVSSSFNLINMKIDAETGEIVSTNKHSIMDLGIKK